MMDFLPAPFLKIIEEPVDHFRFKYKSEFLETLCGENSNRINKTYPTVKLFGYEGEAIVQCWLYQTNTEEPSLHSHMLVVPIDTELRTAPHEIRVSNQNDYIAEFKGLTIIHTARKDISNELRQMKILHSRIMVNRELFEYEKITIDNAAKQEAKNLNTNQVCLCFKVFTEDADKNKILLCDPVYSKPINNKKSARTGELKICRMSLATSCASGGDELMLLVEKVGRGNINVKFYELDENNDEIWHDFGKFTQSDVHHQYAITLRTPPYHNIDITETVTVKIQLCRLSDNCKSDSLEFKYKPRKNLKQRKRPRLDHTIATITQLPASIENTVGPEFNSFCRSYSHVYTNDLNIDNIQTDGHKNEVKVEIEELDKTNDNPIYCIFKEICMDFELYKLDNSEIIKDKIYKNIKNFLIDGESVLHWSIRCKINRNFSLILFHIIQNLKLNDLVQLRSSINETCIHVACIEDKVEYIRPLLNLGADPNLEDLNGNTALHIAVNLNHLSSVVKLLDKTNYILIQNKYKYLKIDATNDNGMTALHISVRNKNIRIMKELLRNGASIKIFDQKTGLNVLHMAVEEQATDLVKHLLQNTAVDVNQINRSGFTPLDIASYNNNLSIVDLLLIEGAIYSNLNKKYLEDINQNTDENSSDSDVDKKSSGKIKSFKVKNHKISFETKLNEHGKFINIKANLKKYIENNGCYLLPIMFLMVVLSLVLVDRK